MKMRPSFRLTSLALLSCLAAPAAHAATETTTFNVTAHVPTSCTALSAGVLAFGDYADVEIDATSTISVTCTNGSAYTVGLSDGTNFSTTRRMKNAGSDYLTYELYKETGRTNRWGNSGGELVSGTGSGSAQSLTVYGRLPASQGLIAGDYTDTITVTVTYTP